MTDAIRIAVAEDEAVVARRVARLTAEILGPRAAITIVPNLTSARQLLESADIDLLLLDLNLEGEAGFDLLRDTACEAFDTIVISAHTDRAIDAFDYGVRDFVPKPFSRERLERALLRVLTPVSRAEQPIRFLGIRKKGEVQFVPVEQVLYARGAGSSSELVLIDGRVLPHEKLLDRLEAVLPRHFERVHKSYLVDSRQIERLIAQEGSRYSLVLTNGLTLPVGRTRVQALRERLG